MTTTTVALVNQLQCYINFYIRNKQKQQNIINNTTLKLYINGIFSSKDHDTVSV